MNDRMPRPLSIVFEFPRYEGDTLDYALIYANNYELRRTEWSIDATSDIEVISRVVARLVLVALRECMNTWD